MTSLPPSPSIHGVLLFSLWQQQSVPRVKIKILCHKIFMRSEDRHQRGPMSFEIIKYQEIRRWPFRSPPPSSYGSLRLLTHLPSLSWPHFLNCHTYLWYIIMRGMMMLFAFYRKISSETILKLSSEWTNIFVGQFFFIAADGFSMMISISVPQK